MRSPGSGLHFQRRRGWPERSSSKSHGEGLQGGAATWDREGMLAVREGGGSRCKEAGESVIEQVPQAASNVQAGSKAQLREAPGLGILARDVTSAVPMPSPLGHLEWYELVQRAWLWSQTRAV